MMSVEATDLRLVNGNGKLRAFVSIKFGDGLIVRGFSVVEDKKGAIVKLPTKATKDGRWVETIVVDDFLKATINEKVLDEYEAVSKGVV